MSKIRMISESRVNPLELGAAKVQQRLDDGTWVEVVPAVRRDGTVEMIALEQGRDYDVPVAVARQCLSYNQAVALEELPPARPLTTPAS